jgi:hypothetical protein
MRRSAGGQREGGRGAGKVAQGDGPERCPCGATRPAERQRRSGAFVVALTAPRPRGASGPRRRPASVRGAGQRRPSRVSGPRARRWPGYAGALGGTSSVTPCLGGAHLGCEFRGLGCGWSPRRPASMPESRTASTEHRRRSAGRRWWPGPWAAVPGLIPAARVREGRRQRRPALGSPQDQRNRVGRRRWSIPRPIDRPPPVARDRRVRTR